MAHGHAYISIRQLHGHTLEKVESAKYLGITFKKNLKWDKHINTMARVVKPKIEILINHPIIVYYDSPYKMGNFGTKIIKIG